MGDPRRALVMVGYVFAIMELIDAFFIEDPAAGIVYAVVVAALAWWTSRAASRWPVVLLGLLALVELLAVLFVFPNSEPNPPSWAHLTPFAVVSALVVGLSVLVLRQRSRVSTGS